MSLHPDLFERAAPAGLAAGHSDAMLLAGFGSGDPQISLLFVRRFQRAAVGVAAAVLRDRGLAEDVAQQAFERAWCHADSYDPRRGSVRTWLMTIVRNLAVDTARVRRPYPLGSDELEPLMAAMTHTPEGHTLACEASAHLRGALAALPPEQARAVVLTAVHGYTATQVAALESIPLGTAKSRIRGALGKLREIVATTAGGSHV
jgi:RNA polymerase sigma-70 factor (ECF subfamily)